MATDVDVQFFSHLNGLTLSNNWGDMIRLLDTCLVNGLPLTSITSATVDAQGDINLTLYAAHNCLLFQIVELSGFVPSGFNGKYRIKGTPTATTLILKAEKTGQTITTTGTAKLASLGYEIKFRDLNDVKRAYRAIDPTDAHPFIRVDESLSGEGGGTYTSTYAKYAMVGLIENMTHIDDYDDPNKLQLPLDTNDLKKNWKISGTGGDVVRGWAKWYHSRAHQYVWQSYSDAGAQPGGNGFFTLAGDSDAFYITVSMQKNERQSKVLMGCGLFNSVTHSTSPRWFLMAQVDTRAVNSSYRAMDVAGGSPLVTNNTASAFAVLSATGVSASSHITANPIIIDFLSGYSGKYPSGTVSALTVPIGDNQGYLRGSLKHICYAADKVLQTDGDPKVRIADSAMYINDTLGTYNNSSVFGGVHFYLGELE